MERAFDTRRSSGQANLVGTAHILVTGGEGFAEALVYDIDGTNGGLGAPRSGTSLHA